MNEYVVSLTYFNTNTDHSYLESRFVKARSISEALGMAIQDTWNREGYTLSLYSAATIDKVKLELTDELDGEVDDNLKF